MNRQRTSKITDLIKFSLINFKRCLLAAIERM